MGSALKSKMLIAFWSGLKGALQSELSGFQMKQGASSRNGGDGRVNQAGLRVPQAEPTLALCIWWYRSACGAECGSCNRRGSQCIARLKGFRRGETSLARASAWPESSSHRGVKIAGIYLRYLGTAPVTSVSCRVCTSNRVHRTKNWPEETAGRAACSSEREERLQQLQRFIL